MRIDHEKPSEHGPFSVEPNEGSKLVDVYVDAITGLLVVEERTGEKTFTFTLEAATGRAISLEERKALIDYSAGSERDEETGLQRRWRREVDPETGQELVHESLWEMGSRSPLQESTRLAFRRRKPETILDAHKKRLAAEAREHREYLAKSFEERAAHWAGMMFRHMRWQNEAGLDELAGFDPAWYADAKSREPEWDRMFDFILDRWESEFRYQDVTPDTIRRRVGKPTKGT